MPTCRQRLYRIKVQHSLHKSSKRLQMHLGITLKHATTKHAQTIGMLERTHDALKRTLKIETGERRSMWHKYVHIAVLNHNTSYHSSIGCEPSRVFHRQIPLQLDLKLGIRPQRANDPDSNVAQDVLEQTKIIHEDAHKKAMQAYLKYKAYYDKKANASILKENDHVYILQPKANQQGSKIPMHRISLGLDHTLSSRVLPNNNYVVRKIGTHRTQTLHRMRIRPFQPRTFHYKTFSHLPKDWRLWPGRRNVTQWRTSTRKAW